MKEGFSHDFPSFNSLAIGFHLLCDEWNLLLIVDWVSIPESWKRPVRSGNLKTNGEVRKGGISRERIKTDKIKKFET